MQKKVNCKKWEKSYLFLQSSATNQERRRFYRPVQVSLGLQDLWEPPPQPKYCEDGPNRGLHSQQETLPPQPHALSLTYLCILRGPEWAPPSNSLPGLPYGLWSGYASDAPPSSANLTMG